MVRGLCAKGNQNVPVRDSLLTHFLFPFLSGDSSFVSLISCISLDRDKEFETLRTLEFSADLSNKKLAIVKKQEAPKNLDVLKLEAENQKLKEQL